MQATNMHVFESGLVVVLNKSLQSRYTRETGIYKLPE